MPAKCEKCEAVIEPERAREFLTLCLACARDDKTPVLPVMVYDHKTAGQLEVACGHEQVRKAKRFNRRAR